MNSTKFTGAAAGMACLLLPSLALADELSGADTAWILTSTALVLFMTIPGLALFYAGLVRSKNVLSVLMQCFAIAGVASILWLIAGYSLAFGEGNDWIGGLQKAMLLGIDKTKLAALDALTLSGVYLGSESAYYTADAWSGYIEQPAAALIKTALVRDPTIAETYGTGVVAIIDTGTQHSLGRVLDAIAAAGASVARPSRVASAPS